MKKYLEFIKEGVSIKKQFLQAIKNAVNSSDSVFVDEFINIYDKIKDFDPNFVRRMTGREYIKEYSVQKALIDRGRIDILSFFYKHNLLNDNIKKENPDLFKAIDWGLVS